MASANLQLGFSTGVFYPRNIDLVQIIESIYKIESELLELNFASPEELSEVTSDVWGHVKKFQKFSIHAPFKNITYGSTTTPVLVKLSEIVTAHNPEYILFHPDVVTDFRQIYSLFGEKCAFENMDKRKGFGNKLSDLEMVFQQCPKAKWVFDLNHIYSIDRTMDLADRFYQQFSDRLVGYHVSGYLNETVLHTCLFRTQETMIIDALKDRSMLIIDEGGYPEDSEFLKKEYNYLSQNLNKHLDFL